MIYAAKGKNYTIENGLSDAASDWFIVGKVFYPLRVDKTLGWRDPGNSLPTFVGSECFLAIGATFDGTNWIENGDDAYVIPAFGIEETYEYGISRSPRYIRGKVYTNSYEISEDEYDLEVLEIETSAVRVDHTLEWREPLETEAPYYIQSGVAICKGATYASGWTGGTGDFVVPVHTISKIYEWDFSTSGAGSFLGGPQGPQGPDGLAGISISGGSGGTVVITGAQGPTGPDGATGPAGSSVMSFQLVTTTPEYPDFSTNIYGVSVGSTADIYLPVGTVADTGKTITVLDYNGIAFTNPINIYPQGIETIDGKLGIQIQNYYGSYTFCYTGVGWQIVSFGRAIWDGFTQTADSTPVTATTTETTVLGAGYGSLTVPANQFAFGESFRLHMGGHFSCANNQNLTIRVKTSDSGGNTTTLSTVALTSIPTTTAKHWYLITDFTIRAVGASGTASIVNNGTFTHNVNSQNALQGLNFSQVISNNFDTTLDNTLIITAQWGSNNASNTIYSESCLLRKV